jgi:hypothetical protein
MDARWVNKYRCPNMGETAGRKAASGTRCRAITTSKNTSPPISTYAMSRRRAAGIATKLGNHSFRAPGITAYLKDDDTLEKAAAMANHDAALEPALAAHEQRLAALDETEAAEAFFDIRIADIAMGSGHFLVAAVDRVERRLSAVLAKRTLPGVKAEIATLRTAAQKALGPLAGTVQIEDAQLLRRLIARRCIYGVDLNPLAVDLARLSIWIHTFVPGLPLSLLDHSLRSGNALVGIATLPDAKTHLHSMAGVALSVEPQEMLAAAAPHLQRLARIADATPEDVEEARYHHDAAREAVGGPASLFDAAVAVSIGDETLRLPVNLALQKLANSSQPLDLRDSPVHEQVTAALAPTRHLHMPIAFPEVFLRPRPYHNEPRIRQALMPQRPRIAAA